MAKLVYLTIASLDGYIEDPEGKFDWAVPDPEVHEFVNDMERQIGTSLYGRRTYETMAVWETIGDKPDLHPAEAEYAEVWRGMDKVVYSKTLDAVTTSRTTLEREFDPEAVRRLKESSERDLGVSGPTLAQSAFEAGLVDEVHQLLHPILVGGGKPALPHGVRLDLELVDQRRFASGVVYLHHRPR